MHKQTAKVSADFNLRFSTFVYRDQLPQTPALGEISM